MMAQDDLPLHFSDEELIERKDGSPILVYNILSHPFFSPDGYLGENLATCVREYHEDLAHAKRVGFGNLPCNLYEGSKERIPFIVNKMAALGLSAALRKYAGETGEYGSGNIIRDAGFRGTMVKGQFLFGIGANRAHLGLAARHIQKIRESNPSWFPAGSEGEYAMDRMTRVNDEAEDGPFETELMEILHNVFSVAERFRHDQRYQHTNGIGIERTLRILDEYPIGRLDDPAMVENIDIVQPYIDGHSRQMEADVVRGLLGMPK